MSNKLLDLDGLTYFKEKLDDETSALLAGKQDKIDADHKLSYTLLTDTPTIPDAQIQSDWNQSDDTKKDFIKNKPTIPTVTGKADKVSGAVNGNFAGLDSNGNLTDSGSKASDFATSTQGGKADTAYQLPSGGIPSSDMSEAVRTSLGKADTALQSFTETDPTVPSWAKAQNPPTEIFWATYGTTTASEIDAAVTAGKAVMCEYRGALYVLTHSGSTEQYYYFGCGNLSGIKWLRLQVSNSAWDSGANYMQNSGDRVSTIVGYESNTNKYPNTKAVADYAQTLANLRTSFQSTPDDSHYPSEKLVKDSLDTKYEKPSGGIPESDLAQAVATKLNNIFFATYGSTALQDIATAYGAGKLVCCVYDNRVYVLANLTNSYGYFGVAAASTSYYLICSSPSSWTAGVISLERTSNKVTSFQSTPDDSHYPSEKLVKDSLDAKQPTIDSSHKLDYGLLSNTPTIPDAVEPNPTVPSGTTPTSLTGLKIGSGYYDIEAGGGTVTDVTVGGTSVVSNGVAAVPAIPTIEALTSNEIDTLWTNN